MNNMNLYKLELKKLKRGLIIWTLVLSFIIILYMSFFTSMKNAGFNDILADKMNMLPEALLKALGLDNMPNFSDFNQYFAYVYQFVIMAVYVYSLVLGTTIISREESEKTIEYLYANPVSRREIITSKLLSCVTSIFILFFAIFIVSLTMGLIFADINVIYSLLKVIGVSLVPVFVYMSIGLILSVLLRRINQGTMIALGIFFGTYIIGVMSNVIEKLDILKYVSPYNYAIPMAVLRGNIDGLGLMIGVIVIIVSIFFTYFVYKKKDMNI